MMHKAFNVFAAVAIAGTMVAAQDSPSPSPRPQPQPTPGASQSSQQQDQSITGCLVQGSGPTVFLLENAKLASDAGMSSPSPSSPGGQSGAGQSSASAASASGRTYVVTAASASADLKSQLNHQVTVIGTATPASAASSPSSASSSSSSPSAGQSSQSGSSQRMNEQNLPRITAKSVVKVADTCSSAG